MPCYHPLRAFQKGDAKPVFQIPGSLGDWKQLLLPCSQCIGCRLEYGRQWAVRLIHESQMHEFSWFVTLTYNDENLKSMSLNYEDFQLFMKRLRKAFSSKIRFFMCGEYGDITSRPHYHAILYGVNFEDKQLHCVSKAGHRLYTSDKLNGIWGKGFAIFGHVTFESARYVAGYVIKKVREADEQKYLEILDLDTGEYFSRRKEFARMSLKPGIGSEWLEKFLCDVYPAGKVVLNGRQSLPPRFYDNRFELADSVAFEAMKSRRLFAADLRFDEGSRARLDARERVATAGLTSRE